MNLKDVLSSPRIENEHLGKLNDDWIPKLQKLKYFKIFVPKELGGLAFNLTQAAPYLLATARFHGSLGWTHNLVAGANSFCTYFEEEQAMQIFKNDNVMCSGSGTPSGNIQLVGDQMKVSGQWSKCTGAKWATHFTAVAQQTHQQNLTFICPAHLVSLKKDWYGFGLKATSTDQIQMDEVVLPQSYRFEIGSQKSFFHYSLAQTNFMIFARICMSITFEGLVLRLLDLIDLNLNITKSSTHVYVAQLKKSLLKLSKKRQFYTHQIDHNYSISEELLQEAYMVKYFNKKHSKISLQVERLIQDLGMIAIDERSSIHWAYRDVKVAKQHYFV